MRRSYFLLLFGSFLISCSNELLDDEVVITEDTVIIQPPPLHTSGSADFSSYVSIGNSLTAGYSNAALYKSGQESSYPNILASQFAIVGGGEFKIPYMQDNLGGMTLNGTRIFENKLVLDFSTGSPAPTISEGSANTEVSNILAGPFNNLGVPGIKSFNVMNPGYGDIAGVSNNRSNPYYVRFASSPTATIINDAVDQNPTFFSLWIGNNDILGYAIEGGIGKNQTGNIDPKTYAVVDMSDPYLIEGSINAILDIITENGAKGVIANLPPAFILPYFNTIPYNALKHDDASFASKISMLNSQFERLNQALEQLGHSDRKFNFSTTKDSPVIIKDESLTNISEELVQLLVLDGIDVETASIMGTIYGQARPANEKDLLVLTSQNVIGQPSNKAIEFLLELGADNETINELSLSGITWPLEDQWVLTSEEQKQVNTALNTTNLAIKDLASKYDLAFVDAYAFLSDVHENGFQLSNGSLLTTDSDISSIFSLDGIHPTPRGYAILANLFIEAINEKYDSTIPKVEPLDYKGI